MLSNVIHHLYASISRRDSGPLGQASLRGFAEKHGLGILLLPYKAVSDYDSMNALAYYGKIPERKFLLGKWHRPWIDYALSDELLMGVLAGYYQIILEEERRFVVLTEQGHRAFQEITNTLEDAGYFRNQVSLFHISQFNFFEDYEQLAGEIWPVIMPARRRFLDWAGIKPGMRVLELGCGSGPFTFEGGLAERVGPEGSVTAVDPSSGMLARAIKDGLAIALSRTQFRLLHLLAQNLGRPVSSRDLIIYAWGDEESIDKNDLYVYISRIRQRLENNAKNPQFLLSLRGVGYILLPVTSLTAPSRSACPTSNRTPS